MEDEDEERGQFSRERYLKPGRAIAFGGRNIVARYTDPPFKSNQKIEDALTKIDSYSRHREPKRPKHNPYFIYSLRYLIQADLCDKSDLKEFNDGITTWLVVIDCFSRKVWVKALKRKTLEAVIPAMRQILSEMPGPPVKNCETDRGSEFTAQRWKNLMQQYDINHRYCNIHASFVERVSHFIVSEASLANFLPSGALTFFS